MKADTINALATLAWPVLAFLVLVVMWPTLRGIIRTRGFTIQFGGMQVTVAEASGTLLKSVNDLQEKVGSIMKQIEASHPATSMKVAATDSGSAEPVHNVLRTVLWVDDHPTNNAVEMAHLTSIGVNVLQAADTDEALRVLKDKDGAIDVVITDMSRRNRLMVDRDAGITLIVEMRTQQYPQPVFVYASRDVDQLLVDRARDAGAALVTSSPVELLSGLQQVGAP